MVQFSWRPAELFVPIAITTSFLESAAETLGSALEWFPLWADLWEAEAAEAQDRLEKGYEEYLVEGVVSAELDILLEVSESEEESGASEDFSDYIYDGISDLYDD